MPMIELTKLLVVIITGNPLGESGDYDAFERELEVRLSAVVINHSEFSQRGLRPNPSHNHSLAQRSHQYPKPVTLLSRDIQKNVKPELFDAEINHKNGVALQISDIRPNTKTENDIFPDKTKSGESGIGMDKKDIFTPPEQQKDEDGGQAFFITENENRDDRKEDPKVIRELHSQESGDEEETSKIPEAAIQDEEAPDEDEFEDLNYGS